MPIRLAWLFAVLSIGLAASLPATAQQAAYLCQVRGLDPNGDDFLAARACPAASCDQVSSLHEGDTLACGAAVGDGEAWREILLGGTWRYAANRYLATLPVEPHPALPSLSQADTPAGDGEVFYLDACYQCMSEAEKTVYLKDVLAEIIFQTGARVTGEGDNETGNICATFDTRTDAEAALALAHRLIAATRLKIRIEIAANGCPVG